MSGAASEPGLRSSLQNLIRSYTISLSGVVVIGSRGYNQYDQFCILKDIEANEEDK